MADLFDRAILIGMGLEKKAREALSELQSAGKSETEAREGGELPPKEAAENKVVEEGIHLLRDLVSTLKGMKEKVEGDVTGASEKLFERMGVATDEEIEVVKEMARVAREKADELERRVAILEGKIAAKE
ncbi:MAG: accessory factor UbiK family protein [Thermodesulfobacteriota bacterium]